MDMMVPCGDCGGEGTASETQTIPCPVCKGAGDIEETCDVCKGEGCPICYDTGIYSGDCGACSGCGEIEITIKCTNCQGRGWAMNPIMAK